MAATKRTRPKHVGTWVLGIIDGNELMKWGKGADCKHPYPPDDNDAIDQVTYLISTDTHADDVFYIAHVFDNGQMKTFSFDENDVVMIARHGKEAFTSKTKR